MTSLPHILITGATGFVGQAVIQQLDGRAVVHRIIRDASKAGPNDVVHDLSEPLNINTLPKVIDAVFHMAQSPNYRNFPDCAPEVFGINVRAMAELLDYAAQVGASSFVHCSTGSVYEPYVGTLTEDRVLAPSSINGATKLAAEALSLSYESLFSVSRLRLFMPYGPGQTDKLLPDVINRVLNGRAVNLQGGTGPVLAPVHVKDAATIIIRAHFENWSGTFNVASTESFSLLEIVDQIANAIGIEAKLNVTEGTPPNLVPDIDKLTCVCPDLRFRPFVEGLMETIETQMMGAK